MCGIWAVFGVQVDPGKHHQTVVKITHRGPDAWRTECDNRLKLRNEFGFEYESKCDVECILHLYEKNGADGTAKFLDGVFAFCLVDTLNRRVILARDPFGVRPLFRITGPEGVLAVCSEAKGLIALMKGQEEWRMDPVLPGYFEEYELNSEGGAALIRKEQFYVIGDKPQYSLAVSEEG
ncbi:Hypothetical predicted protein [Cloeon dipterum]|uniref:Glutamine-dependent asparagine synthetase n=1 Tax=Cloeon dipterum TaxID=197152 RepID=A0A8S1DV27_9INSE|nr:Hypothetical predicted protein [Cloeon dipterum]